MALTMAPRASTTTVSSAEAAAAAGVSYRQLDYWCREGIVRPAVEARGSGTSRRWWAADVAVLRAVGRLSDAGVCGVGLREAARRIADLAERRGWVLVDPYGGVELVRDAFELVGALDDAERPTLVVLRLDDEG